MVAVSVRELEKRFGSTVVLDGVDLDVPDGSFAVLVGPSGCGKSTLLRLVAGLEAPSRGNILFGERDVTRLEPRDRDVAMVFQSYALYPHLSVRDNLAFGLKLRKAPEREIDSRIAEVSRMLGIDALLDRMPRQLSGGQRQRVAMGRAIVRRPALFLFDEPLSNLDAALRSQVRIDIRRLHGELGVTSVYVTHDQVEAMTLADVMFVLNHGRIEQRGAPLDVYATPATRFVASFLGSPRMNFFVARMKREHDRLRLLLGGSEIELEAPSEAFAPDSAEREVTLGIRPHDLALGHDGVSGSFTVRVILSEALGGETYAHATLAGEPLCVRLDPDVRVAPGDTLTLRVPPGKIHLFDPESGKSLRC
jgi:sn-glycerol 3-phosphate transport system ATP-binding protein/multiple sugar transport system ATP-binding protein